MSADNVIRPPQWWPVMDAIEHDELEPEQRKALAAVALTIETHRHQEDQERHRPATTRTNRQAWFWTQVRDMYEQFLEAM